MSKIPLDFQNARVKTLNGLVPLMDIEPTAVKDIWRGKPVTFTTQEEEYASDWVYFSRKYNRETNEIDKMVQEFHIDDSNILGIIFWLIPKEKLLFLYDEHTAIIRPHLAQPKRRLIPRRQ